ncbi:MAG: TlpA family protein disulfide reductase [Acidobacteria bacterium]|nr:TlpA family protein disulfide reductase [Acidobacteriota bacterium]
MHRRRWLTLAAAAPLAAKTRMSRWQAKTIDGEQLDGAALKGQVVLVQHWATWCGYCRKDEPAIERILSDHAKDGLVVIAINANEPRAIVKSYLKSHQRTAKIVLSPDTNLSRLFDDTGVPAYILIDREGNLAGTQAGSGGLMALRELLKDADLGK